MAVRDFNKKRKPIDIEKVRKCYGCQYFYADQFHGFVSCHCGHEKYMTCHCGAKMDEEVDDG